MSWPTCGPADPDPFTSPSDSDCWAAGTDPRYLRDLVAYWARGFDWRAAEAALNAVPQFTAEVDGRRVHFAHLRGRRAEGGAGAAAAGAVARLAGQLRRDAAGAPLLTDPEDPADAFDVVSRRCRVPVSDLPRGPHPPSRGARWHQLMTESLGSPRYGAFGGDIGGGVTQAGRALPRAGGGRAPDVRADGRRFRRPEPDARRAGLPGCVHAYDLTDQGYSEIMWTRPDTIAAALADSPAGLAAWIVDKYRDWSDCGGDVTRRWDRDTLVTMFTLYWATGCVGSSFRSYYNYAQNPPVPQIVVPTAVTLSNSPAYAASRAAWPSAAARTCGTGARRGAAGTPWPTRSPSRWHGSCASSSGRCAADLRRACGWGGAGPRSPAARARM